MFKHNGICVSLDKSFYNKTKVQEDGITHIVDTDHQYSLYYLDLHKTYFDLDDRDEAVKSVIADLRELADKFEELLNEKQKDGTEEIR